MALIASFLAGVLATAPAEGEALRVVQARFERAGRTAPPADPALTAAARDVALQALESGAELASGPLQVAAAVSRHGGWDPSPLAVVIRGTPEELLTALGAHALAEDPVSVLGVGVASRVGVGAVAALLATRRIELDAFTRSLPAASGQPRRLCGRLLAPLTSAQVFVTRPGGEVLQLPMPVAGTRRCATLSFPEGGRHVVEVLASGPRGPQVAALFFVDVGAVPADERALGPEPGTDAEARAELLARTNRLRRSQGALDLVGDATLDRVAQAWARRLAAEGFFAHVAPDGGDLRGRLGAAGYAYRVAGENLALGRGPLAAHFGIEHSPGHRKNLLEPQHRALGVGLARRPDGLTVLVEVLACPSTPAARPSVAQPQEAAYRALESQRRRLRLPAMARSPVLEALAQEHARAALVAGLPRTQLPGRDRLEERVFSALEEVRTAAVDVFVAEDPAALGSSRSLEDASNTLVGVGVSQEPPAPGGKGRSWIVVIYAGAR